MTDPTPLRALPAPDTKTSLTAVPEYHLPRPSNGYEQAEPEEATISLSHYLWIVRRHKWRILAFVLVCVGSTVVVPDTDL
jgi:hypothetical protein